MDDSQRSVRQTQNPAPQVLQLHTRTKEHVRGPRQTTILADPQRPSDHGSSDQRIQQKTIWPILNAIFYQANQNPSFAFWAANTLVEGQ